MPLYLSDRTAGLVFWTIFAVWALVEMATYVRLRTRSRGSRQDRGSRVVLIAGYWLAIFAAFAFALGAPSATIGWHRQVVFYLGVALLVLGVLLRQYAIATLGRLHTLDVSTGSAQPVIQTGPYRWVRHPSYAGAMLTARRVSS